MGVEHSRAAGLCTTEQKGSSNSGKNGIPGQSRVQAAGDRDTGQCGSTCSGGEWAAATHTLYRFVPELSSKH